MRKLVLQIGPDSKIEDYRIEALSESDELICRQALDRIQKAESINWPWTKHLIVTAAGLDFISKEAGTELFKALHLADV